MTMPPSTNNQLFPSGLRSITLYDVIHNVMVFSDLITIEHLCNILEQQMIQLLYRPSAAILVTFDSPTLM